jgi:hypothetical protein
MTAPQPSPITVSFATFLVMTGLNERKGRQLIAQNQVTSVRIGKRRFVLLASYHAYLDRLLAQSTPKKSGNFGRGRAAEGCCTKEIPAGT